MGSTGAAVALLCFVFYSSFFCTIQIKGVSEHLANYPAHADAQKLK